ncbi:MAG: hypothetical protein QXN34_03235 [Archaeoglobaceae archaeon]
MIFELREELAKKLKKGNRVVSPFKVGIGWVDIAILGRESTGIEFCINYESSLERLNSYPFKKRILIGDGGDLSCEEICKAYGIEQREFFESNITLKRIEDAIAFLYMAKEVLEDENTFEELKILGYATSYSRAKIEPTFFLSLTNDGYRVAKKIIYSRISANEKKLFQISSPLSYVLALGISRTLTFKPECYEEARDLKSLLALYRRISETNFLIPQGNPKTMLCEFLVKTVLNCEALKLAEKLCNLGLAVKVKLYSPSGDYLWDEFRFSREVIEFLIKSNFFRVEDSILLEFNSLIHAVQRHPEVYETETIKKASEIGVCRIENGKLILKENFDEFARVRFAIIAEKILQTL